MITKEYKHISHLLLYPLLNIPYYHNPQPIGTYMAWKGMYSIKDSKLILEFNKKELNYELKFKKMELESNECYISKQTFKDSMFYIFDLETIHHSNFKKIQKGKYSEISPDIKYRLVHYYKEIVNPVIDINKVLYPKKHLEEMAKELGVDIETMQKTRETLSKLNRGKEVLDISKWKSDKKNIYLHK